MVGSNFLFAYGKKNSNWKVKQATLTDFYDKLYQFEKTKN